jgi:LuxR family transcriptional regulator, maltose regulon positive regulatory protein
MTAMISNSSSSAHREDKPSARSAGEGTGAEIRDIFARPRPRYRDRATAAVRTPVHDVPEACRVWMAAAFLLGAIARDTLGDPDAAGRALQRALDLTAPDPGLPPILIQPPPRLPDRHPRHHGADAAMICQTADLLARLDRPAPPPGQPAHYLEALSHGEIRVLRYLQTNLSAREIASELYISVNTVKTHQRHLYRKLGAHSRTQAVGQARALGLLAPSARAANRESQRDEYQL